MEDFADFLIDRLTEWKELSWWFQIGSLVAVAGTILGLYWKIDRAARRGREKYVREIDDLKEHVATQQKVVTDLNKEIGRLAEHDPDRYIETLELHRKEGKRDAMIEDAQAFLDRAAKAQAEAWRISAEDRINRALAGEITLEDARFTAMGSVASDPQDGERARLLDDIEILIRTEDLPPGDQVEERQKAERDRLRRALAENARDPEALRAVARSEFRAGRYSIAILLLEHAEAERLPLEQSGRPSRLLLVIKVALAEALVFAGRLHRAGRVLPPLRQQSVDLIGAEDPISLSAGYICANLRMFQGRAAEAEAMFRALLPLNEKVKGREHPDTLKTRYALATTILTQGRAAEADAMLRELLPLKEKVEGREHPDTLKTRHTLATAILDQGRAAEAEAMLRELLPLSEKVDGREHPGTLTARHELARSIHNQGRAAEAEAMLRELLPLREKVDGREHPHTLAARRMLARAVLERGDAARAREILAPLPADGGDTNPLRKGQTALLRARIADLEGRLGEAEALLAEAEGHLAHLEPEHSTRRELAKYRETRGADGRGGTTLWMVGEEPAEG